MSSLGIVIWIATFALCAVYFYIAFKQKKEAELSFANYAIGGGKIPFFLLFFTHFANIMGVGNFMGHADITSPQLISKSKVAKSQSFFNKDIKVSVA
jgi:Na+/proline symporter